MTKINAANRARWQFPLCAKTNNCVFALILLRGHKGGSQMRRGIMYGKLSVLIIAACALSACETKSGAVMAPPIAGTGTPMPAQAPVSYQVFFPLGSTKLSDQDMQTMSAAAQVYKTKANATVTVTGYADTVGSPDLNMRLSQARADAVK